MKGGEERGGVTHRFEINGKSGYLTTVVNEEGQLTDLFVDIDKEGSTLGGWVRAWAVLFSLAIQGGVPLEKIVSQFKHWTFGVSGMTMNEDIHFAKSIPDYIVRWLELKFLGDKDE